MSSSSSSSNQLVRKADDSMQLMPPPPLKRIKRPPKVIPEDDYTDALSEIIARDFFPGLLESKHQQDYLDALDSQDSEWIAEASRRLTEVMSTPQHRRRGTSFATPVFRNASATPQHNVQDTPKAPSESEKKQKIDTSLSLDAFLEKYTSEDNASFNEILDKQNEKRRNAYAFLWNGNKIPGFRQIAHQKRLKAQAEEKEKLGPDGEVKMIMAPDTRKAVPNTWNSEPRNGLMFVLDHSPPPPERKEGEKELPPKAIAHSNTRMPPPSVPETGAQSVAASVIGDAIAGRPRPTESEPGFGMAETPRVNGYSFVDDAPSPSPSELGAPPLTWGNVASISSTDPPTLSSSATPSPFKIAATPKRELLHHRMVEKVAKSKRSAQNSLLSAARTPGAKTPAGGHTARMTPLGGGGKGREIPKFGSAQSVKPSPALTPAGARLWGNLQGRKESGLRESLAKGKAGATPSAVGGGGGRGFRWTPTPVAKK